MRHRRARTRSAIILAIASALLAPSTEAAERATYTYDALGRLVVVSKANGGNGGSNTSYQYDNAGNRANVSTNASWTLNSWYAGDFNGDGRSDILWRNDNTSLAGWLGQTDGGFVGNGNLTGTIANDWRAWVIGDFNGDGRSDVFWRRDNGDINDWLGQANGSLSDNAANVYGNVPLNWQVVGVGDFNGDGRSDLLWRYTDGTVTTWLGTATNGFNGNTFWTLIDPVWKIVATRDFNGDGRADVLFRKDTGEGAEWLGQTNGLSDNTAAAGFSIPPEWHIVGSGDFNGDGRNDILWRHNDGTITNWLANTNGSFSDNWASFNSHPGNEWNIVATGDHNGDGKADLLWRDTTGAVSTWLATSSGAFTVTSFASNPGNSWHVEPRRAAPTSPVPPPASFSIADAPAIDEGANAIFTVTRIGTYQLTQTVNYATAPGTATSGSDFTATSGTLTFAPTETQKTVSVPTAIDSFGEPAETLTMTLSSPGSGAVLGRATATGTINVSSVPNQPPIANSNSASVGICDSVSVNVIANDTDPDGNYPLTLVSVGTSNLGGASVQSSTNVYFAAYGSPGSTQITYTVRDSLGATSAGVLGITVTNGSGCM